MFTWLLASRGPNRLAAFYLVLAGFAFLFAFATWVFAATHHSAAGQTTLQLHITRYSG